MASVKFENGKRHSMSQIRAHWCHDIKEQRVTHCHNNEDIDLDKTKYNWAYFGTTMNERMERVEEILSQIKMKSDIKYVLMHELVVYPPEALTPDEQSRWLREVAGPTLREVYGERFIDMDVHMDEVHYYVNPRTGRRVLSRVHGHADIVPFEDTPVTVNLKDENGRAIRENGKLVKVQVTDEDGNVTMKRRLNACHVTGPEYIRRLNDTMEKNSQEIFGINFNSGEGKFLNAEGYKDRSTVEELKERSFEYSEKLAGEYDLFMNDLISMMYRIQFEEEMAEEMNEQLSYDKKKFYKAIAKGVSEKAKFVTRTLERAERKVRRRAEYVKNAGELKELAEEMKQKAARCHEPELGAMADKVTEKIKMLEDLQEVSL